LRDEGGESETKLRVRANSSSGLTSSSGGMSSSLSEGSGLAANKGHHMKPSIIRKNKNDALLSGRGRLGCLLGLRGSRDLAAERGNVVAEEAELSVVELLGMRLDKLRTIKN